MVVDRPRDFAAGLRTRYGGGREAMESETGQNRPGPDWDRKAVNTTERS